MKFYNTMTRKLEDFTKPKDAPIKMYACGPTVYDHAHIGNLRTYINEDILRRFLELYGYQIDEVMNITDIEDKIIRTANEKGVDIKKVTDKYTDFFLADLEKLNIEIPEHMPRATEEIDSMIRLVSDLLEKGFAYKSDDGSVYFSIKQFTDYGKLAHLDFSGLKEGARIDSDEYDKDNAQDFVLWKAKKAGEPAWEAPFGAGRPGWHIECSAMSMEYLGETVDIHAGAVDLVFPHHENEIAQSEASTGKKFVDLWFHGEHLMINGAKMSKSLKNIYTLDDIVKMYKVEPLDFRMLCLGSHYREKLNFTDDSIIQAKNTRANLADLVARLTLVENDVGQINRLDADIEVAEKEFKAALSDDLNMPKALAVIQGFRKIVNKLFEQSISDNEAKEALNFLYECDKVLGLRLSTTEVLELSSEVSELLLQREIARNKQDWSLSDKVRAEIEALGYEVEDTKGGQKVRKI